MLHFPERESKKMLGLKNAMARHGKNIDFSKGICASPKMHCREKTQKKQQQFRTNADTTKRPRREKTRTLQEQNRYQNLAFWGGPGGLQEKTKAHIDFAGTFV